MLAALMDVDSLSRERLEFLGSQHSGYFHPFRSTPTCVEPCVAHPPAPDSYGSEGWGSTPSRR